MKKIILFWVVLFLFLVLPLVHADINTLVKCSSDVDCQGLNGGNYYCKGSVNEGTATCFLKGEEVSEKKEGTTGERLTTLEEDINELTLEDAEIKKKLDALTDKVWGQERDIAHIFRDVNLLLKDVLALQGKKAVAVKDVAVKENLPLPSSGRTLAGQAQLSPETAAAEETGTTGRVILLFVLFMGLSAVVAFILLFQKRKDKKSDGEITIGKEIVDYITALIKRGKKFSHIQETLRKAGWNDQEITSAYRKTIEHNYRNYRQIREKVSRGKTNVQKDMQKDMQKTVLIIFVALLLVVGIFFLLRGTVGQAISTKKLIGGKEGGTAGEETYALTCTPPQILTPLGDSCCTDGNNNGKCDVAEREVQVQEGGCTDNNQCSAGEFCIDAGCAKPASIYVGSPKCEKLCNYYTLKLTTSDGESYSVKPKGGSYTAVGAVQWDIMEAPDHCEGEKARVMILITKKEPGKIVGEEVITLRKGETSKVITHPRVPDLAFTLTMGTIYETCA